MVLKSTFRAAPLAAFVALSVVSAGSGTAQGLPDDKRTIVLGGEGDWKKGFAPGPEKLPLASQATPDAGSADGHAFLESVRFCAAIPDTDGRLACYDSIASHYGIQTNQTAITAPASDWIKKEDTSKNDYLAALSSSLPVRQNGEIAKSRVILYLRCLHNQPSLYFKTGDVFGGNVVSAVLSNAVGETPASGMTASATGLSKTYDFQPSSSGDAFGIWNAGAVKVLSDFFKEVPAIRLTYQSPSGGTTTARFDLSQYALGVKDVEHVCGLL